MSTAEDIIRLLKLTPHPEGGYYRETYRSKDVVKQEGLPPRYSGPRCFGTAIYYLLTPGDFSMMHRVKSDELFHFYMGDPVEILKLYPDGTGSTLIAGNKFKLGYAPQVFIEKGVWQGLRLKNGGKYALFGTTVSPGFEFDDFEIARRSELLSEYPAFRGKIIRLTKPDND